MKQRCCGCLAAIPVAILFLVGGLLVLEFISESDYSYSNENAPAEHSYSNSSSNSGGSSGSSSVSSDQPWGYSSRLYTVLVNKEGHSFSQWISTINRDVLTYWAIFSEDYTNFYNHKAVPANQTVRQMYNRTIDCGNTTISDKGNGLYCGGEDFVALDFDQYEAYVDRYGPIFVMFGLGHEWGHAQQRYMTFDHTEMSVLEREKQADCFAGMYISSRSKESTLILPYSSGGSYLPPINSADLSGLKSALDFLSNNSYGYDRYSWFRQGFDRGFSACLALAP